MAISGVEFSPSYRSIPTVGASAVAEQPDARDILRDKIEELSGKVKNGETEQSFQLGGKSYTQDEWDKMLAKVDRVIEQIRTENREEQEEKEKIAEAKAAGTHVEPAITDDQIAELFRDRG